MAPVPSVAARGSAEAFKDDDLLTYKLPADAGGREAFAIPPKRGTTLSEAIAGYRNFLLPLTLSRCVLSRIIISLCLPLILDVICCLILAPRIESKPSCCMAFQLFGRLDRWL